MGIRVCTDIQAKLKELEERHRLAELGGGEERIERQHNAGKFTARERLKLLLDEGSFQEIDKFVTHRCTDFGMDKLHIPGDGVVTGSAASMAARCLCSPKTLPLSAGL